MPNVTPVVPLQPAPTTADKVAGFGTYALNTAVVTGAPMLSSINPALNPSNAGGVAVNMIGDGITCIVQAIAVQDWYNDHKYAVWACIVLSIVICGGLYIVLLHNPEQGVLNALGAMYKASSNYGPLKQLGVFNRGESQP